MPLVDGRQGLGQELKAADVLALHLFVQIAKSLSRQGPDERYDRSCG
jgi:hypothetical protein